MQQMGFPRYLWNSMTDTGRETSALSPVVLKPNSKGQETAKARIHTVAIMTDTLLRELSVVLYSTGITTAVYLKRNSQTAQKDGKGRQRKTLFQGINTVLLNTVLIPKDFLKQFP